MVEINASSSLIIRQSSSIIKNLFFREANDGLMFFKKTPDNLMPKSPIISNRWMIDSNSSNYISIWQIVISI